MSAALRLRCPAKLNLGLEVLGKRPDGYHEIRTLFMAIDLADELQVESDSSRVQVEVEGATLPPGRGNLVHRAAEALRRSAGVAAGARLRLRKRIPVGAGLGGGSSDAAVTLMALDRLWDTRLGLSGLAPLAEELGSDVPYFLRGGVCLGLGRGEKLYPVEWNPARADFLLACPPVSLSTPEVYSEWDAQLTSPSKDSKLRRFLASALSGKEAWDLLSNDLEEMAIRHVQAVSAIKVLLAEHGAKAALVSGSGSSVFGVFLEPLKAEAAAASLSVLGHRVHRCRALGRAEYRDFIGLQ